MFLGPWIRFFGELFVVVSGCFLGRVHGGAQIVPEKIAGVSPCLRMFFGVVYGCFCWQSTGGCCKNNFRQQFKDKLSYP